MNKHRVLVRQLREASEAGLLERVETREEPMFPGEVSGKVFIDITFHKMTPRIRITNLVNHLRQSYECEVQEHRGRLLGPAEVISVSFAADDSSLNSAVQKYLENLQLHHG